MQERKKPKKQLDVTAGPLARPLVRFCVPLILTSIMQLLFNACDIIVVGQFVGSAAVAAVGSTLFLINVFMTFFVAMSAGVTIILSTDFGRKDHNSIVRGAHTAICLGILFGFGVLAVGVTCARTFLTWTSTPKEILDQAALYLRIYYAGSPFFLLYTFGRAVLITTGDTRRPMIYLAISGLANVALNLFLVIQCHLGVAGVAIGTISSQLISAILVLRRLSMIEGPCHIYFHKLKLHRELVRRIFRQGLPSGVQSSIFSFSNILIQTSINSLGKAYIAASSASGNLEGFVWMSMDAVCQSGMTFTGQNYGAMQPDRIKKVFRLSALYSTIVSLAMGIPIAVFGHSLLGIYLPDDPAAVHAGLIRLTIMMLTYWTCGLMNDCNGITRGMNRPLVPMLITLIGVVVPRIIWNLLIFQKTVTYGGADLAFRWLILTYPASWVLSGIVAYLYYRHVLKQVCRLAAHTPSHE